MCSILILIAVYEWSSISQVNNQLALTADLVNDHMDTESSVKLQD